MDLKVLATVFGIVFLAELGDKTQLATLLFASKSPDNLIAVFVGAWTIWQGANLN
jgi:putative Ca2+/H+ antiporter (TMEM165/GDT1 family)